MKQTLFFLCILWITGLVACGKNGDSAIPETSSNINVVIAVQGGHFDVLIDTAVIGSNMGEGESTNYKSFRAQRYNVFIYEAGNRSTPVASGQLSLRSGHYYSAFLSVDHTNTLRLMAVEDYLLPKADPFNGKIRIVDLSDSYTKDAISINLDVNVADLTDTLRFKNLSYLAVTGFTTREAGSYSRNIFSANTTQSLLGKIDPAFTVVDGKFTSWIVYGNALVSDSFKLATFTHN